MLKTVNDQFSISDRKISWNCQFVGIRDWNDCHTWNLRGFVASARSSRDLISVSCSKPFRLRQACTYPFRRPPSTWMYSESPICNQNRIHEFLSKTFHISYFRCTIHTPFLIIVLVVSVRSLVPLPYETFQGLSSDLTYLRHEFFGPRKHLNGTVVITDEEVPAAQIVRQLTRELLRWHVVTGEWHRERDTKFNVRPKLCHIWLNAQAFGALLRKLGNWNKYDTILVGH